MEISCLEATHGAILKPSFEAKTVSEKVLGETQTLRAGRSNAGGKTFHPATDPFAGMQDSQNLISWRWSLPAPTDPVW